MKTGLLNKRIEILGKQDVTDEYGFDTQADVVVYRCWASIEPARGKVFQNHLYDIDTIVDPYMRHEALELYCTEEVRGTDYEQSGL